MTDLTKGDTIDKSHDTFSFTVSDNLSSRLIFFLCCILIIAFREIDLLKYPRMWAEEGSIWYAYAQHHSLIEIFTTDHVGYTTLFSGLVSAIQVKLFKIEDAAMVSTYLGFLVQLIPVYIIVFTTHSFWRFPYNTVICLITIICTAPELWVNTGNSKYFFGLITFLILVVHTDQLSVTKKWFFRFLLALGTLSGPPSILLAPVFFIKAYLDKTREKIIQSVIMAVCSMIQMIVIIYSLLYNNDYHRLKNNKNLYLVISNFFIDHFSLNLKIFSDRGLFYFGAIVSVYFIYLFIKNWRNKEYCIFSISFVFVAVFSTLGSLNMTGSPRYAFVPTCILMMLISQEVFNFSINKKGLRYIFGTTLFLTCFIVNTIYYKTRMQEVYSSNFPVWKQEVETWRMDNNYVPKVHPTPWILEYPGALHPHTWIKDH